jgi:sterol desaturase/sphingolipid hydroxylase (fatty acid hydroxylase superfamily)
MNHKTAGTKGRIFNSGLLEFFTRTHPVLIFSMYIPVCFVLLWYFYRHIAPSFAVMSGLYFFGMFSWTFFEYILHRYVFHFTGEQNWKQRFHYLVHGVHHDYPRDEQRLVMPPVPSIILALSFFFLFRLIFGQMVFAYFSGFISGYLIYALIHYSTHAFRPPKNRLRFLWEYHNKHHFKYTDKAFGVSSPLWDYVFGTVPPVKTTKQPKVVVISTNV